MRLLAKLLAAKQAKLQAAFEAKQAALKSAAERKIEALESRAERLEERADSVREHFNAKADSVREHYNAKAEAFSEKGLDHLAARFEALGEAKASKLEAFGEKAVMRLESMADRAQSTADALKAKLNKGQVDEDDVDEEDDEEDEGHDIPDSPNDIIVTVEFMALNEVTGELEMNEAAFDFFGVDPSELDDFNDVLAQAEELAEERFPDSDVEVTKITFRFTDEDGNQTFKSFTKTEDGWVDEDGNDPTGLAVPMTEDELAELAAAQDEDEDETADA